MAAEEFAHIRHNNSELIHHLKDFYSEILFNQSDSNDETKALAYFDNMTKYLDLINGIQIELNLELLKILDRKVLNAQISFAIIIACCMLVLPLSPTLAIRFGYNANKNTDAIMKLLLFIKTKSDEIEKERERSETLLRQMLPKYAIESMKQNAVIPPESFGCVTICFIDVYGFGVLVQKCTPQQVVDLLNDIFSRYDNVLEQFDAYKVETISDNYMVASGVPNRNGMKHVEEIANFTLQIMNCVNNFEIIFLSGEHLQIRIGINTGPCAAGVMGTKLPHYCLFGDTVNTASRMKSSTMPGMIQITSETQYYMQRIGLYKTEYRGLVNVKGKGLMLTYFLLGSENTFELSKIEAQSKFEKATYFRDRKGRDLQKFMKA